MGNKKLWHIWLIAQDPVYLEIGSKLFSYFSLGISVAVRLKQHVVYNELREFTYNFCMIYVAHVYEWQLVWV